MRFARYRLPVLSFRKPGERTFLTIWIGQMVSVLGSGLTGFGIGVWVFQKTGSATAMSLIALATSLPGVLLSPVSGVLVDRWNRRTALLVSEIGAGVASTLLAALALSGHIEIWHIYVLTGLSSAFAVLSWPAMSAAITTLLPKVQFGRANGLVQGAEAASFVLSPILGAFMFAKFGLLGLLVADVVSFGVMILALLSVRIPNPPKSEEALEKKPSIWKEVPFGFTYIFARKGLLGLLCFFLLINLFGGLAGILWTPLLLSLYSPLVTGNVMSSLGIGMLIGTAIMGAWGGPKRRIHGVLGFCLISTLGSIGMALPPSPWLYGALGAFFMASMPIVNASSQAIWQSKVAPEVQGKVFAARRMIAWFTTPLAALVAGPLADKVFEPAMRPGGTLSTALGPMLGTEKGAGIRLIFVIAGFATAAACLVAYAIPKIRNVEDDIPDAAPSVAD